MNIPTGLKYTKSHEWVDLNGDTAKIGITDYAQEELGSLVFVNLPEQGDEISQGSPFSDVESVKAVSDVNAPVTGRVTEVNEELLDNPELINESPYEAWFVQVEGVGDTGELIDAAEYEAFCNGGE